MTALLNVKDLRAYYGQVQALHGLSFSLNEGSLTTLLGANGAGKTTTLRAICNMVRSTGAIEFEGKPLNNKSTESIVRFGIAHVPQGRGTFTNMTVEENLQLGAYPARARDGEAARLAHVLALFPRLTERMGQAVRTMSGGEQQMVAIGRALMSRPQLLMLDEPSLGLSPLLSREVFRALRTIRGDGVSILMVEQNARASLDIADRVYLIEQGRNAGDGAASEMKSNADIQRAYLGQSRAPASAPATST